MSDQLTPYPDDQDDQLAEFTDRVLRGEEVEMTLAEQSHELHDFQQTVLRFARPLAGRPSQAMSQRIQANLAAEWRRQNATAQPEPFWLQGWRKVTRQQSGWQSAHQRQRVVSLALAVAVMALILLSAPFISPNGESLLSAARGSAALAITLVILSIALGSLVWWFIRRR
jgi:hypothetical protein